MSKIDVAKKFSLFKKMASKFEKLAEKKGEHNYRSLCGGIYFVPDDEEKEFLTLKWESRELSNDEYCLTPAWKEIHPLVLDLDNENLDFDEIFKKILPIIKEFFPKSNSKNYIEKNRGSNKFHVIFHEIFVNEIISETFYLEINKKLGEKTVDVSLVKNSLRLPDTLKPVRYKGGFCMGEENTDYIPYKRGELTLHEYLTIRNLRRTGELVKPSEEFLKLMKPIDNKTKMRAKKLKNPILEFPEIANKKTISWINEKYGDKFVSKPEIFPTCCYWVLDEECPFLKRYHDSDKYFRPTLVYNFESGKVYKKCKNDKCKDDKHPVYEEKFNGCVIETTDDESDDDTIDTQKKEAEDFLKKFKDDIHKINTSQWYIFNHEKKIYELNAIPHMVNRVADFLLKRFDERNEKPKKEDFEVKIAEPETDDWKLLKEKKRVEKESIKLWKNHMKEYEKEKKRLGSSNYTRGVVKYLEGDDNEEKDFRSKLNPDRSVLSVKNGVLDLKTGEVRERTREDMLDYILDITYTPQEIPEKSELMKFLNSLFSDYENPVETQEQIDYLQRLLGYCITGEVKEQCFFVFIGDGANGKGVLKNLTSSTITKSLATDLAKDYFVKGCRKNEGLVYHKTQGKRVGFVDELGQGDNGKKIELDMSIIKKFSGVGNNSVVECKELYRDSYDGKQTCKIIINLNPYCLFKLDTDEYSEMRRIKTCHFGRQFLPKHKLKNKNPLKFGLRDDDIEDKIINEGFFLNWLVQGAVNYYKNGLVVPKREQETMIKTFDEGDSVKTWLRTVKTKTDVFTVKQDCYQHYKNNSNDSLSDRDFWKVMKKKGFKTEKKKPYNWERGRTACYQIDLQDDEVETEGEAGEI